MLIRIIDGSRNTYFLYIPCYYIAVLRRAPDTGRALMKMIMGRQKKAKEYLATTEKIKGKRASGKQRKKLMNSIMI